MKTLANYIHARLTEFDQISYHRRHTLEQLGKLITHQIPAQEHAKIVFVCTHNSRRSQLAQAWATTAAFHFAISKLAIISAGTQATEVDRRTIDALGRAGFTWKCSDNPNPTYTLRINSTGQTISLFSKTLLDSIKDTEDCIALMTCSRADLACPTMDGVSNRISLCYDDPKTSNGTSQESDIYDTCCQTISREMLYAFSTIQRS